MTDAIEVVSIPFLGFKLPTVLMDGAPWWVSTDISRVLEYKNRKYVSYRISQGFVRGLTEDVDYLKFDANKMPALRMAFENPVTGGSLRAYLSKPRVAAVLLSAKAVVAVCDVSKRANREYLAHWVTDEAPGMLLGFLR